MKKKNLVLLGLGLKFEVVFEGEILRPSGGSVSKNIVIRNKEIGGIMCTNPWEKVVPF
jgi:hypothetical protein